MSFSSTASVLLLGLGIATVVIANRAAPRVFLGVVGFLLPLASVAPSVGVNVTWYLVLGPLSLLLLPLSRAAPRRRPSLLPGMAGFLLWVTAVTVVWMVLEYVTLHRWNEAIRHGAAPAQALYRMPVQILSFLFQVSAVAIVGTRARTPRDARAAFRGFLLGVCVSVVAGILLLGFTGAGMITATPEQAEVDIAGRNYARIGGLSNEPRHLGSFIVVVFAYLIAGDRVFPSVRRRVVAGGVLLLGLFLTLSTSAWVALLVSGGVYAVVGVRHLGHARLSQLALVVFVATAAVASSSFARDALRTRIEHRLEQEGELETQKDYFVVQVFADHPEFLWMGFGVGGFDLEAYPYIPPVTYHRAAFTPTPTSNGMRMLGELGLVGVFLFVTMVMRTGRGLVVNGAPGVQAALVASAAGLLVVSTIALSSFLFLAGAAVALVRLESSNPMSLDRAAARASNVAGRRA